MKIKGFLVVAGALFAFVGCSSTSTPSSTTDASADASTQADAGEHTSPYPSCQAILSACHELDTGEGPIHECHEVAHDATSEADCAPRKAECLATCVEPADAGADAASDAHDHDH